jgi:hypothetical protein
MTAVPAREAFWVTEARFSWTRLRLGRDLGEVISVPAIEHLVANARRVSLRAQKAS